MKTIQRILLVLCCLALLPAAAAFAEEAPVRTVDVLMDTWLQTVDGEEFTLRQTLESKKMVIIQFFATYSNASRAGFPALEKAYERWRDQAAVVAISTEYSDTEDVVRAYAGENGLSFSMVAGSQTSLPEEIGVRSVPTMLVLDRFGKIALHYTEARTEEADFERVFDYFCSDDYTETVVLTGFPPARAAMEPMDADALTRLLTRDETIRVTNQSGAYVWPFRQDETGAVSSTNGGQDDSVCGLTVLLTAEEGDAFSYRFRVSSEELFDALMITVDGREARVFSGDTGWRGDTLALSAGEHVISFRYMKDERGAEGEDLVSLADFSLLHGAEAAAALKELPQYPVDSRTRMELENEDARNVWVEDPSDLLQKLYGPVRIFLLEQSAANLNLTLTGNENPWTVCVLTSNQDGSQMILPYRTDGGYRLTVPCDWDRLTQITAAVIRPNERRIIASMLVFPNMDSLESFFTYLKYVYRADLLWDVDREDEPSVWSVTVLDTDGAGVPGCRVMFRTPYKNITVVTDETGTAEITGEAEAYHVTLLSVPYAFVRPADREAILPEFGGDAEFILVRKQ